MNTEQQNKPETMNNPTQKELDLDFLEPITPKSPVTPAPSLLDKTKGLMGIFAKKNNSERQFTERREPTFGEQPTIQEQSTTAEPAIDPAMNTTGFFSVETDKEETTERITDTVNTANTTAATVNLKNPESWKVLAMLPPKYRRIFIALLIAILLLIVVSWLKPSEDTVKTFEQADNSIPTQFQSLDNSQPAENTLLDELKNPPATSEVAVQTTNIEVNQEPVASGADVSPISPTVTESKEQMGIQPFQPLSQQAPTIEPATKLNENSATNRSVQEVASGQETAQPRTTSTSSTSSVASTSSTSSAVKKSVEISKTETAKGGEKAPVVEARPVEKSKQSETKAKPVTTKNETKAQVKAPVVDAKPAKTTKTTGVKNSDNQSSSQHSQRKTLSVPQGTSLMQVFRNHGLNIADVNAMTKANGAGKALSSFKAGDKVQVSINTQGRVSELRLSNGGRFIRQPDGSYQYKK